MIRVSGTTQVRGLAGSILTVLEIEGQVDVFAIGPEAVNQAVKGCAVAAQMVPEDRELLVRPMLVTEDTDRGKTVVTCLNVIWRST